MAAAEGGNNIKEGAGEQEHIITTPSSHVAVAVEGGGGHELDVPVPAFDSPPPVISAPHSPHHLPPIITTTISNDNNSRLNNDSQHTSFSSTPTNNNNTNSLPPQSARLAVPRRTSSVSTPHKPRPLSMPPQSLAPLPSADRDRERDRDRDRDRHRADRDRDDSTRNGQRSASNADAPGAPSSSSAPAKSRTTNRILGDYTLSKTLGAGSMGKVKLAHHNLTGEKVRLALLR